MDGIARLTGGWPPRVISRSLLRSVCTCFFISDPGHDRILALLYFLARRMHPVGLETAHFGLRCRSLHIIRVLQPFPSPWHYVQERDAQWAVG